METVTHYVIVNKINILTKLNIYIEYVFHKNI